MSLEDAIKMNCCSENKHLKLRWLPIKNINTKLYYSVLSPCFAVYSSLGTLLYFKLKCYIRRIKKKREQQRTSVLRNVWHESPPLFVYIITPTFEWANIAISALRNRGRSGSFQRNLWGQQRKQKIRGSEAGLWLWGGQRGTGPAVRPGQKPGPALDGCPWATASFNPSWAEPRAFSAGVIVCNNLLELGECWQQLFWFNSCFLITWGTACFCQKSRDTRVPFFLKIPHYFPTAALYLCWSTQHKHIFAGTSSFRHLF